MRIPWSRYTKKSNAMPSERGGHLLVLTMLIPPSHPLFAFALRCAGNHDQTKEQIVHTYKNPQQGSPRYQRQHHTNPPIQLKHILHYDCLKFRYISSIFKPRSSRHGICCSCFDTTASSTIISQRSRKSTYTFQIGLSPICWQTALRLWLLDAAFASRACAWQWFSDTDYSGAHDTCHVIAPRAPRRARLSVPSRGCVGLCGSGRET